MLTLNSDRVEVEWKWLLLPDPADFHLPKASAKAIPMPSSRKAQDQLNARRLHDDKPKKDDAFVEGYTWAEFRLEPTSNKDQARVDFSKPDQTWHYLGKTSTDARAQYTEDPARQRHNPKGNFLDTLPKPPKPAPAPKSAARARAPTVPPAGGFAYSFNHHPDVPTSTATGRLGKPYTYKPKTPPGPQLAPLLHAPQKIAPSAAQPPGPAYQHNDNLPRASYPKNIYPTANPGPADTSSAQVRTSAPLQHPGHASNMRRPPGPYQKAASIYQIRPTWQVHSSVYYKYPFFQVNHNRCVCLSPLARAWPGANEHPRDSSKYRTPYAAWGGFTNGYEGDLRAHLMARQSDLLRRPNEHPLLTPVPIVPNRGGSVSHGAAHLGRPGGPSPPGPSPPNPVSAASTQHQNTSMLPPLVRGAASHPWPPAVKTQARVASQHMPPSQQPLVQVPRAKTGPAQSSTKVGLPAAVHLALQSTKPATQTPPKQSPVPLPANFLAAMASSPSSSQSCKPGPVDPPPQAWTATERAKAAMQTSQHAHVTMLTPGPGAQPSFAMGTRGPHATPARLPSMSLTPSSPQDMMRQAGTVPSTEKGPGPRPAQSGGGLPNDQHGLSESPGIQAGASAQVAHEFSDVPGCESTRFVERMMENLKRASQRGAGDGSA